MASANQIATTAINADLPNKKTGESDAPISLAFRMFGAVPLIFFSLHFIYHAGVGRPYNILWLCNLNNLLLAVGILFDIKVLVRIAALWLIPGFPLWFIDSMSRSDWPPSSVLAHIGGLIVGMIAIRKVRMKRSTAIYAFVYAMIVQHICRIFGPPDFNANVARFMYQGWEDVFSHYWQFWIFIAFEAAAGMWLLSLFLTKLFPVQRNVARIDFNSEKV